MSEYMPDTDEVREAYIWQDYENGYRGPYPRDGAEFDNWLAQHDAEVALGAVQRVIRKIDKSPAVTWTGTGGARHIAAAIEKSYRRKEEA